MDKEDLTWIKLWLSSFPSSSRPVTPWHLPVSASAVASVSSAPQLIKASSGHHHHHLNHLNHHQLNQHGFSVNYSSASGSGQGTSPTASTTSTSTSTGPLLSVPMPPTAPKSHSNNNSHGGGSSRAVQVPPKRRLSASGLFSKIVHEFNCDSCNTKFEDKAGLLVHHPCYYSKRGLNKGTIEGRGKMYTCDIFGCGKTFSLLNNLRNHTKFHIQEYNFQCNFCAHQTKIKGDMVKHTRVHTGERPFPCPYCGKDFRESRALDNHIRTHTGEKPHRCDWKLCSKSFATSSELSIHRKRVHTMERNFRCPFVGCSAAYVTNRERTAHVKASHPGFVPNDDQLRQGFKGKNKLVKLISHPLPGHMNGQPMVQVQVMPGTSSGSGHSLASVSGLPSSSSGISAATHVLVGDLVPGADPRQQVFRFPIINLIS